MVEGTLEDNGEVDAFVVIISVVSTDILKDGGSDRPLVVCC